MTEWMNTFLLIMYLNLDSENERLIAVYMYKCQAEY
jgi:hypothetical protein